MSDEFDDVINRVMALNKVTILGGILENADHPESDLGVAEIAFHNEYGVPAKRIPPRPFMWKAFQDRHERWEKIIEGEVIDYLDGKIPLDYLGFKAGGQMEADIQESIKSNMNPPNSPATIRRKKARRNGEDRGTLRDTETMLNAVSFIVETE